MWRRPCIFQQLCKLAELISLSTNYLAKYVRCVYTYYRTISVVILPSRVDILFERILSRPRIQACIHICTFSVSSCMYNIATAKCGVEEVDTGSRIPYYTCDKLHRLRSSGVFIAQQSHRCKGGFVVGLALVDELTPSNSRKFGYIGDQWT
jgi:hypothetical protein